MLSLGRSRNGCVLSVIVALNPELSCLGSQDVESCLPCRFRNLDLDFLWQALKGIVCGGGDGYRYVRIGATLDQVIAARGSPRRLFTLILVGCVLAIIYIYLTYCVFS